MQDHTNFEELNCEERKLMVEASRLAVVLQKQEFVGPVEDDKVEAADGVQDWHAARIS